MGNDQSSTPKKQDISLPPPWLTEATTSSNVLFLTSSGEQLKCTRTGRLHCRFILLFSCHKSTSSLVGFDDTNILWTGVNNIATSHEHFGTLMAFQ